MTLGQDLMSYLYDGEEPRTAEARDRCKKAAGWLKVGPFGELLI